MIPQKAKNIMQVLLDNGKQAYIAGGAVRDTVMGREPHDWDITTDALPDEVKRLFPRTLDTGIKHGTVTVMDGNESFELTTFRTDGKYSDGRHPDSVSFTGSLTEDLSRRDFTMNAMAMDISGKIIDPFNGKLDIVGRTIRAVGNPDERFREDSLRMLRAVRFASQLGFIMDASTELAIEGNAGSLKNVSGERIRDELTKLLSSDLLSYGMIKAWETGITKVILPEFDSLMACKQNSPYHDDDAGHHTLKVLRNLQVKPMEKKDGVILKWAGLLHDMGKPYVKTVNEKTGYDLFTGHPEKSVEIGRDILDRLKFPNADKDMILDLVRYHDYQTGNLYKLRRFGGEHGKDFCDRLFILKEADAEAHAKGVRNEIHTANGMMKELLDGCFKDGSAIPRAGLKINGGEVMEYGIMGKAVGEFLDIAYKEALTDPSHNSNVALKRMAEKYAI